MAVVIVFLRVLAAIALIAVVAGIVLLLLPLGFAVEYRPGRFRVSAVYGPWQRTIWAHRTHRHAFKTHPPERANRPASDNPPEPGEPLEQPKKSAPQLSSSPENSQSETIDNKTSADNGLPPDEEEEELPEGAMGRLERMLVLLEEDPKALGNCVLGHMRWLHRHSFFKISIRQTYVYWTVTCEDAATTAIVYGTVLAALNTALELVQQTVLFNSRRLWLEPDFTGQHHEERRISCIVSARAILMLHLLYRIWKDPLLQPLQPTDSQTT